MAEARESQRFSITLSAGTYALLKVQAEKDGRSLANTVNKIVTEALTNTIENRQTYITACMESGIQPEKQQ